MPRISQLLQSHLAVLCALTIAALFLFAAQVSSKQTPTTAKPVATIDPFALKNPNAFDPARRRVVRAMKEPATSATSMASGIDAAEADAPGPDVAPGRLAANPDADTAN